LKNILSSTDQFLEELEKDHCKIDHSEAGAMFMGKWWAISDKVNIESVRQRYLGKWLKYEICEVKAQS
jgi:hypothetical protein